MRRGAGPNVIRTSFRAICRQYFPFPPREDWAITRVMSTQSKYQIKLRRTGGVGANANWHWEVQDAEGKAVKTGSAVGAEHKAFATARIAMEKLEAAGK